MLDRTRKDLSDEGVWNRHDNRRCPTDEKMHSLCCALERASTAEYGHFEHRAATLQEVRFVIDEITVNKKYDHRLVDYNNDPHTTIKDIYAVIDLSKQLISLRLKAERPAAGSAGP